MMNRQRLTDLGHALLRGQRGITGLETAIILIAFVVVASVFAFTVLTTGLFSAERGKETVHAGLREVRGTMEMRGSVISTGTREIDDFDDTPVSWQAAGTPPTNIAVAVARDTDAADRQEGTASVEVTITVSVGAGGTGLLAFNDITAIDLAKQKKVKIRIRSDTTLSTANQLQLLLDDTAGCTSAEETLDLISLTANTWATKELTLVTPANLTAVACVGLNTGASLPIAVYIVHLDFLEGTPPLNGEVRDMKFVVSNAVAGEPIDLTTPTDADGDSIPDSTSSHKTLVAYQDANQSINDVTWTVTFLGENDGDALLEVGEIAEIKVEVAKAIDTKAGTQLRTDTEFTLEMKPPKGAVLIIERTTPSAVDAVMDLK